jgi:hypothetical protein
MMTDVRLTGLGLPPPPPPPPPPGPPPPGPPPGPWPGPWFGPWPPYQPIVQPQVYIERGLRDYQESPCKWYEDLQGTGDMVYCRAPAVWLVIAAVGAGTIWFMRGRR